MSRHSNVFDPLCSDQESIKQNAQLCCKKHKLGCDTYISEVECRSREVLLELNESEFCCKHFNLRCPHVSQPCNDSTVCAEGICVFKGVGGQCEVVSTTEECSVSFCTAHGAEAVCTSNDLHIKYATCDTWYDYLIKSGSQPCSFTCSRECWVEKEQPIASDGSRYCTQCALEASSCNSGFKIHGPIEAAKESKEPFIEDDVLITATAEPEEQTITLDADLCNTAASQPVIRATCCEQLEIGCPKPGDKCSTAGNLFPSPPCSGTSTCVIFDFGFPAADTPNRGQCLDVGEREECSVDMCSRVGAEALCQVPDGQDITNCGAWARRTDGGLRPNCSFFCTLECVLGSEAPIGSDGNSYCSECQLRLASCASGFQIFGPVA